MRLSLEYIAGFLDCDGTVVIVKADRSKRGFNPEYYGKLMFYSQNYSVLEDIKETIGGTITPPVARLACYSLQLSTKATVAATVSLLPYLRIKKEQALVLLALEQLKRERVRVGKKGISTGGQHAHSAEVLAARHELYLRMRELNHRDSKAFRSHNEEAHRTNRVNSGKPSGNEAILSQAAEGEGSAEGATTRSVSPNNNPIHEPPARKGRYSLSSAEDPTVH